MAVLPLGGTPARASLVILDPPSGTGSTPGPERSRIRLHFSPDRVSVGKQARWDRSRAPSNAAAARPQFIGAEPRTMTLDVFLDAPGITGSGVQDEVEKLLGCCVPTTRSAASKPASAPWVRLEWGRSRTTGFLAVVTQVNAAYTRFRTDGTPLRAECSLTLEEVGSSQQRQNPSSGADGPVGTHLLVSGDTLPGIAWRTYGDATCWREIARANGIDDPERLRPGTTLVLPVLEDGR
ncbi:LysM peptidoglycan-binding domain-containing protein [Streptomyces sp. AV19]|uniref:CIS tube protein n=1 Tax=Streptomyces sp. AV19 TaxID=2793068 RepID=UPI0018FEA480|nr:LysM peptidoglycan-binding domain-containing protein [Streptomyces sp. AV19]MBH1934406.1 LysM peptidoglycan-binding domain-containing protein [Streptomyces sp. AV19]MDG4536260.1 LysM peptidoglycan-binding domain-containing protein [Streptomyces sp. AV19]